MEITYEQILSSPLTNKAELARLMWPENKNPKIKLSHKLSGTAGQRLTDTDKALIVEVFLNEYA